MSHRCERDAGGERDASVSFCANISLFRSSAHCSPPHTHSSFLHLFFYFFIVVILFVFANCTFLECILNGARARWLALSPHLLTSLPVLIVAFERILIGIYYYGLCFCRRRHTREHLLAGKIDEATKLHFVFIMHSRFA